MNTKKRIPNDIKLFLKALVIGSIFFFLAKNLLDNWSQVRAYNFRFDISRLIVSIILAQIHFFLLGMGWYIILRTLGSGLKLKQSVKVAFLSQFGKYIPGKVWVLLGKVYLGSKEGLSKEISSVSALLEVYFVSITGILIFLLYQFYFPLPGLERVRWAAWPLSIMGIFFLCPTIFKAIIKYCLKLFKIPNTHLDISTPGVVGIFLYYLFLWLFTGITFLVFISSFCHVNFQLFFPLVGILAISYIVGFVVIFAPGGIGVREGTMTLFLQFFFPLSVAILIALLYRIWVTISEVLFIPVLWTYVRERRLIA